MNKINKKNHIVLFDKYLGWGDTSVSIWSISVLHQGSEEFVIVQSSVTTGILSYH